MVELWICGGSFCTSRRPAPGANPDANPSAGENLRSRSGAGSGGASNAGADGGAGTPVVERLPYFPEAAIAAMAPYRSVVLAGAKPPVSFFGYPGAPSYIIPPEQRTSGARTLKDAVNEAMRHGSKSKPSNP